MHIQHKIEDDLGELLADFVGQPVTELTKQKMKAVAHAYLNRLVHTGRIRAFDMSVGQVVEFEVDIADDFALDSPTRIRYTMELISGEI